MIAVGAWRYLTGTVEPVPAASGRLAARDRRLARSATFMVLTAFSNGCTAMTGVEAVSNGVPAFRPPESRNAAATLVIMAVLSIAMFIGITLLAHAYRRRAERNRNGRLADRARHLRRRRILYYAVQAATMLILVLAANTAYADFPRLASIVARDRFLPRQFMNQGDRLAFSNGIVILSVLAGVLLVAFGGDTHALIPLYMIGVFVSFTLSQAGMVIHWRRLRTPGWRTSAAINGFGALVTGIVLVIVATTKAFEGAWIILVMIPMPRRDVRGHAAALRPGRVRTHAARLAAGVRPAITPCSCRSAASSARSCKALQYATHARRPTCARCTSTSIRPRPRRCDSSGPEWGQGVELVVLESPYRSLMEPLLEYIEQVRAESPERVRDRHPAEFVPRRIWHHLLHNQHALLIKGALLFKPNVIVTSVPFHLGQQHA